VQTENSGLAAGGFGFSLFEIGDMVRPGEPAPALLGSISQGETLLFFLCSSPSSHRTFMRKQKRKLDHSVKLLLTVEHKLIISYF
jgi:hypothetical protein